MVERLATSYANSPIKLWFSANLLHMKRNDDEAKFNSFTSPDNKRIPLKTFNVFTTNDLK